jgi:hypothetical protein
VQHCLVGSEMCIRDRSNYAWHYLLGDGSSVATSGVGSQTRILSGRVSAATAGADIMGVGIIDVLDYSNANKNKTVRVLTGQDRNGGGVITLHSGVWLNNTAISSITITNGSATNFTSTSNFALYGIKG